VYQFHTHLLSDWDDAYCTDLLKRLRIGERDRISTLSFGSRTKLALVIALSHHPDLLLLDEPLAGLDALSKQEVFAELLRVVQDDDRTVIISSHDLHDLERLTDHIGIINEWPVAVGRPHIRTDTPVCAGGLHPAGELSAGIPGRHPRSQAGRNPLAITGGFEL
jgi:ABC-type Mn2+/Zn2+ transport system ATPase subunit